jgi:hypothetical protein
MTDTLVGAVTPSESNRVSALVGRLQSLLK